MVPEGKVEHDSVKALMAEVEGAAPGGDEYDAQVHVMSELIERHVKEEEEGMFSPPASPRSWTCRSSASACWPARKNSRPAPESG